MTSPQATHPTTSSQLMPPKASRWGTPMGMAFIAHALLVLALAWGVAWQRNTPAPPVVQAELWSQLPTQSLPAQPTNPPRPISPSTPPQALNKPVPAKATAATTAKAETTPNPQADIALQRQKQLQHQREKQAQQDKLQQEKQAQVQAQAEKAKQLAAEKAKVIQEQQAKNRLAKDKPTAPVPPKPLPTPVVKAKPTPAPTNQAKPAAADDDAIAAAARASERLEQLKRKAQGTETTNGGSAGASTGLSKDYESRIFSAVGKIWAPDVKGNPTVDVTVKALPDGTMTSVTVSRPSGQPTWDDAVVAAIKAIRKLPADANGHIPAHITLVYSPLEKR